MFVLFVIGNMKHFRERAHSIKSIGCDPILDYEIQYPVYAEDISFFCECVFKDVSMFPFYRIAFIMEINIANLNIFKSSLNC
jgi:hypothetical protein